MLKAISLFTGLGGLDFGFEAAGFETRVALEYNSVACQTLRLNRGWQILEGDIHSISSDKILETACLQPGEADVLFGGPPCQPFSKSGYWSSGDSLRLNDPRADTLTAYLRVLRDTRPKTFLLENVYGLVYKGKDEGLRHLLEGIDEINELTGSNYKVNWKVLNSADFGVPQMRERVFLIASRDGTEFNFPMATHSDQGQQNLNGDTLPWKTCWDALADLEEPDLEPGLIVGGKWGELLPTIPEGQNYLWHTNRGGGKQLFGWRTRYWSFLLKLAKNRPSWTIQAQPGTAVGPFHWKNRRLTPQEMCRLQTFPDGLEFNCGRTEIQRMVGNAVPSLLSEVLAHEIRSQLLGLPIPEFRPSLLPAVRSKVPEQESVESVPAKYMALVGDHDDHPGEKKMPVSDQSDRNQGSLLFD